MACGTGKTLVGLWASEKLGPRTLLTEPSLALVAQNLREWRLNARGEEPECLVVCSDQSVTELNADEVLVRPDELGARVTTSAEDVAAFLRGTGTRRLLVTTLHSSPVVAQAMAQADVPAFDCTVIDEAHRTATREESAFTVVLDQAQIRSRTRLFLTATPRVYRAKADGDDDVVSMSDEKVYGPRAYTLSFRSAIERGLLCDYQVVVPLLAESDFHLVRQAEKDSRVVQQTIAEIGFLRAAREYGLSKVVTFHSSVNRATRFAEELPDLAAGAAFDKGLWVHAINGAMPSRTRDSLVGALRENAGGTLSILSNCRCLTEGVDVPTLDGIVFFDPRNSEIDLIQAIGRVMRLAKGKSIGTVVVPVVVSDVADPEKVIASSAFRPLWQVVRALRSIDDAFEARCRAVLSGGTREGEGGTVISSGSSRLVEILGERLQTKVIQAGLGISGPALTEEKILRHALIHKHRTGKLPSQGSGDVVDESGVPTGDTWNAFDQALRSARRGLPGGSSLPDLFLRYGLKKPRRVVSEEDVVALARAYLARTGRLPAQGSGDVFDEDGEAIGDNWLAIDGALRAGTRGFGGESSLADVFLRHGLKAEKGDLNEAQIVAWARAHLKRTGELPTQGSGLVIGDDGHPTGETWGNISGAGNRGGRGLPAGSSLPTILLRNGLKSQKGDLEEAQIVAWAQAHLKRTGKLPTQDSGPVIGDDGKPAGEDWRAIDKAGKRGRRGLLAGSSLPEMLKRNGLKP
jgi:superfamily II DNA or RNA helicase